LENLGGLGVFAVFFSENLEDTKISKNLEGLQGFPLCSTRQVAAHNACLDTSELISNWKHQFDGGEPLYGVYCSIAGNLWQLLQS
jgi:hypothetical protein